MNGPPELGMLCAMVVARCSISMALRGILSAGWRSASSTVAEVLAMGSKEATLAISGAALATTCSSFHSFDHKYNLGWSFFLQKPQEISKISAA